MRNHCRFEINRKRLKIERLMSIYVVEKNRSTQSRVHSANRRARAVAGELVNKDIGGNSRVSTTIHKDLAILIYSDTPGRTTLKMLGPKALLLAGAGSLLLSVDALDINKKPNIIVIRKY